MENDQENNIDTEYKYYFTQDYLIREEVDNNKCAEERYEFLIDGEWVNDCELSLRFYEERKNVRYLYYYFKGNIAREEIGNQQTASERFEFYENGKWKNIYGLSLNLSDATMNCCGYTFGDYEELTEEEAMRMIAEADS